LGKGKKIGLALIIGIIGFFVIGFTIVGTVDEETKAQWAKEGEERKQQELQQQIEERRVPTRAQDIEPSKLKSGFGTSDIEETYYNNAENLLTEYVLAYKGQDKSGKTMKDALIDFSDCNSKSEFSGEIEKWNNEKIKIRLTNDWVNLNCGSNWYLDFNYDPHSDRLYYVNEQTFVEIAKSTMFYLDQNP